MFLLNDLSIYMWHPHSPAAPSAGSPWPRPGAATPVATPSEASSSKARGMWEWLQEIPPKNDSFHGKNEDSHVQKWKTSMEHHGTKNMGWMNVWWKWDSHYFPVSSNIGGGEIHYKWAFDWADHQATWRICQPCLITPKCIRSGSFAHFNWHFLENGGVKRSLQTRIGVFTTKSSCSANKAVEIWTNQVTGAEMDISFCTNRELSNGWQAWGANGIKRQFGGRSDKQLVDGTLGWNFIPFGNWSFWGAWTAPLWVLKSNIPNSHEGTTARGTFSPTTCL